MFAQLVLFSLLISYCLSVKNIQHGICQKINLCRKKIGTCHPVVMKCRNGSCRYRAFNSNDDQRLIYSRWFYDSNHQRCRRYNNQTENFVHFRLLRDCRRLCPIIRRKKMDEISTSHVFDNIYNYNDTVYVHLYIDFSPNWMQKLTALMNISTPVYNSQKHYFQNYRRRFSNFVDPSYQLMLDRERNTEKKNY